MPNNSVGTQTQTHLTGLDVQTLTDNLKLATRDIQLPPLIEDKTQLQSLLDRIAEWIKSFLLAQQSSLNFSTEAIKNALAIFVISIVLILLVWILVCIYKRLRPRLSDISPASLLSKSLLSNEQQQLAAALQSGHFSLAARWRWRLHLAERGLKNSLTPQEGQQLGQNWLRQTYQLMFGFSRASKTDYEEFDQSLSGKNNP